MCNLLKVKTFIIFFITTINAYEFQLCCPYFQQYNILDETCSSSVHEPHLFTTYSLAEQVTESSAQDLNSIDDFWCRNEDGSRMVEKLNVEYYLQENGGLYVPTKQDEIFKSNRFCLNIEDSGEVPYTIIMCEFEEIKEYSTTTTETKTTPTTSTTTEYSTTKKIKKTKPTLPTTISTDTTSTISTAETTLPRTISVGTSSADVTCNCNTEPPKFPDLFCENIYLFEKCVKCIIEKTCMECTTFNTTFEYVDVLKDKNNKHVVQVNKKECPYWQYAYNLNKENNTVHISILKQTCDEISNNKTKATFSAGTLFYVGIGFLILLVLILSGIILYCINEKRKDARQHAAFVEHLNTKETELHPMFRPNTEIYSLPENINFN